MFKIYQKYIISKFLKKFFLISLVFFCLSIILGILEEISFLKNTNSSIFLPYLLTLLNAPITLFEIFPFIFLLSTQFFFHEIFKNNELSLFKNIGLSNLKIILVLLITTITVGILINTLYYNTSSKLKFFYTDIKNNYSNDNKYLAAVTDSGLWLKDEINNSIMIIKANSINDNFLNQVIINQFNMNFKLIKIIQAEKIDVTNKLWEIYKPLITSENITAKFESNFQLNTSFDKEKINSLFSNISTLDIIELIELKEDYEKLGYSADEIRLHLLKLFSNPIFYSLMTILSAIIMLNINRNKSFYFYLIIGILLSVTIYYLNYMVSSLGNAGKLPIGVSVFLPISLITILVSTGLITINEK